MCYVQIYDKYRNTAQVVIRSNFHWKSAIQFYFALSTTGLKPLGLSLPAVLSLRRSGRAVLLQSQTHSSILPLGLDPESPQKHAGP